jgi:hypothetical protein
MSRTCDELAACQSRVPACPGCKAHPFAPGVITAHRRPRTLRSRAMWRLLRVAAGLVLFATLVGLWIGSQQ